jgi:hypothetical protein
MVDSLNKADSPLTRITGLDLSAFAPFKTDMFPMVAYKLVENIQQGFSHAYRSEAGGVQAIVRMWCQTEARS